MRKFLAGLLAVLMLASVLALSVGAADATTKTFDKSTKEDAGKLDLVITEIMPQSTNPDGNSNDGDLYEYIELYNRGTKEIDLSNYCLLRAKDNNKQAASTWRSTHKFENVVNLVAGNVYDDPNVKSDKRTVEIYNPDSIKLQPGEFAVIWVWNDDNENYCSKYGMNLAGSDNDRLNSNGTVVSFPYFRDAYSQKVTSVPQQKDGETVPTPMSDDVLVLVAMGSTQAINPTGFRLANGDNYIYAVAEKSMGQNIATHDAITFSKEIACMAHWGFSSSASIPQVSQPGLSTIYVPADQEPYLVNEGNRLNVKENESYKTYTDYVERDNDINFETSYKEMAVFTWWEVPTPGYMMPYQWIYLVGADKVPESAKCYISEIKYENNDPSKEVLSAQMIRTPEMNKDWVEAYKAFLLADKLTVGGEGSGEGETKREEIDYDKIQQDKLQERHEKPSNVNNNTGKKQGLPTWALILIIVGGVVVLGGVAVTVILVLKKKNKPVAADDVAAEGEVEIIDEGADEAKPEENNNSDETKSE